MLFHSRDMLLMPGQSHRFDIADTLAAAGHAVFYQIFDELDGKMKLVIQVQDRIDMGTAKGSPQVLFYNKEELLDILLLLKLFQAFPGKIPGAGLCRLGLGWRGHMVGEGAVLSEEGLCKPSLCPGGGVKRQMPETL